MSTIAINADESLNGNGKDKKGPKINEKASAAMAAGMAGVAAGVGIKAAVDAHRNEPEEDPIAEPSKPSASTAGTSNTAESYEETVVEVNPDYVMLEEPKEEATDNIAATEEPIQNGEGDEYRPFANNDIIEDIVYEGPLTEEVLIAENHEDLSPDDSAVDLICGLPSTDGEPLVDAEYPADDLQAWESDYYDNSNIQSDLMA